MPRKDPPTCRTCGKTHWPFVTCAGEHRGASTAKERERASRQDVEIREKVDMPPLIQKYNDGFRPWGDRLDNFDLLGGHTLVRRREP